MSSIQNTSENVKGVGASLLFSPTDLGITYQIRFTLWPLVLKLEHSEEKLKKNQQHSKTFPTYLELFFICLHAEFLEIYFICIGIYVSQKHAVYKAKTTTSSVIYFC